MTQHNYNDSIEACAAHYGDEAEAVKTYMQEGLKQALRLPNRGPIQFLKNGALHPEIREAYSKYGFYVFEGVVTAQEMSDVRQDIDELRSRFATHPDSKLDARGRPALGCECKGPGLKWSKALSDPLGGTDVANGRHQIKLKELKASADAPLRRRMRKVLDVVGWLLVLLLLFVGLSSLFGRVGFLNNEFAKEAANIGEGLDDFGIRYIRHYFVAGIHLLFGFVVYVCAPFQFMRSIRKRFIGFHRWTGRAWMISGAAAGFTGAFFGVVWPFTGHQGFGLLQTGINAIIGPYTLFCLYKAYSKIRARNFGEHRQWMIRTFALMLGVATQRVLMLVLIPVTGIGAEIMFASCMVLGMAINIAVAEYWISLTRTPGNGHLHWKDLDRKMRIAS